MATSGLAGRFTYRPPKGDQPERYEEIRSRSYGLAAYLDEVCPDSREKRIAIAHVEQAVMWANAAIARHE